MKHHETATANATALTAAIVYFVCRLAFLVAPDISMQIAASWFHGFDISGTRAVSITGDSFLLGLITATVGAWLVGYVFAKLYNQFLKK